jgi:ELWxxDGT repeat protein
MPPALALVAGLLLAAAPAGLARIELRPGVDADASAISRWLGSPRGYVQLGETLHFIASTPGEGHELWGASAAGGEARLVVDLATGAPSSGPEPLVVIDGRLFFAAYDGRWARVFESDGTARGTRRSSLFPEDAATDAWRWSFQFLDMHPGRLTATFLDPGGATAFHQSDGRSPAVRLGAITGGFVTPLLALPERLLVLRTEVRHRSAVQSARGRTEQRLRPDPHLSGPTRLRIRLQHRRRRLVELDRAGQ